MDPATIDLLIRAATVALALAGATALVASAPRSDIAWYAAAVVGGMGAFMAASAPHALTTLGLAAVVFDAWCLATPAFVWLLAVRLFSEEGPPGRWHFAAPVLLVPPTLAGDFGRFGLGVLGDVPDLAFAFLLTGRAVAMGLLLAACWAAVAHWRVDLVEHRRRARAVFVALLGGAFLAMAASTFIFGGKPPPMALLLGAHGSLLALAFAAVVFIANGGMRRLEEPEPAAAAERPALAVVRNASPEAPLAQRIVAEMQARELWRRERLSIRDLALELDTQEYRVRRAINRHLGYRNFNEFLHDYRLGAAASRLRDPRDGRLPVLTIALDSGYGSVGPFNRAFKARFGVTPSQFRRLRDAADGADSGIGEKTLP